MQRDQAKEEVRSLKLAKKALESKCNECSDKAGQTASLIASLQKAAMARDRAEEKVGEFTRSMKLLMNIDCKMYLPCFMVPRRQNNLSNAYRTPRRYHSILICIHRPRLEISPNE